ncbi:hypothetical protein D3C81_1534760 [compost metagenome]
MLFIDIIDEAVGVAVGRHDPAAQGAVVVERAGGVDFAAVVVPGAGAAGEGDLLLGQWPLADHVDGCRRVAGTGHQAGGPAYHLDPIEHRQVRLGADHRALIAARDAVIHQVVDVKTACRIGLPAGATGVIEEQSRGRIDHIVDAGHGLVVHALAGNHGDGLWRFTHGQRQFGCRGHGAGGVGTRAFGRATQLGAGNFGSTQFQGGRPGGFWHSAAVIGKGWRQGSHADGHGQQISGRIQITQRGNARHKVGSWLLMI